MKKKNWVWLMAMLVAFVIGCFLKGFWGGFIVGVSSLLILLVIIGDFMAARMDLKIGQFISKILKSE